MFHKKASHTVLERHEDEQINDDRIYFFGSVCPVVLVSTNLIVKYCFSSRCTCYRLSCILTCYLADIYKNLMFEYVDCSCEPLDLHPQIAEGPAQYSAFPWGQAFPCAHLALRRKTFNSNPNVKALPSPLPSALCHTQGALS